MRYYNTGTVYNKITEKAVLWIRDILERIQIRVSVPLTNGYGSCYFRP
jgi:hypothetical protein